MVEATLKKDKQGNYTGIEINGHANYNPGNDIVCSAISALGYTLIGSLRNEEGVMLNYSINDEGIKCDVTSEHIDNVNKIFEVIKIGLLQIEITYPDNLKVIEEKHSN